MSRVVYYAAASLDGYIAAPGDDLDWLTGYQPAGRYEQGVEEPVRDGYESFYAGVGALASGSVTYEWVLRERDRGTEWPYSGKPWWVFSSRELPAPQEEGVDVRVVQGSVRDRLEELMASADGADLWVVGGGNLASQFADERLLDEVRATVVPVVLGAGKPLFDRRLPGGPMRLTGVTPNASGMVELRYALQRA